MASQTHLNLSPAELAYLHASLSLTPPIRPDGRSPTQYRPLSAETGILPGTNGSARICFADGTEAIVGVKAEVEKTRRRWDDETIFLEGQEGDEGAEGDKEKEQGGNKEWVELTVEIPGQRDDDSGTIFLAQMLSEALLADGAFVGRLKINRGWHWKLYLDVSISGIHRKRLEDGKADLGADFTYFPAAELPLAPSQFDDAFGIALDQTPKAQVRRRRGSIFR